MAYTKGPWRIASFGDAILSEDTVIAEKPNEIIVPGSNWEANAPMLAASPDMYEALKELMDIMQGIIAGDYKPDSFTMQPARLALAKAEGRRA